MVVHVPLPVGMETDTLLHNAVDAIVVGLEVSGMIALGGSSHSVKSGAKEETS